MIFYNVKLNTKIQMKGADESKWVYLSDGVIHVDFDAQFLTEKIIWNSPDENHYLMINACGPVMTSHIIALYLQSECRPYWKMRLNMGSMTLKNYKFLGFLDISFC